jgi:hypothetical protein
MRGRHFAGPIAVSFRGRLHPLSLHSVRPTVLAVSLQAPTHRRTRFSSQCNLRSGLSGRFFCRDSC